MIAAAEDTLFVAAAGNDYGDNDITPRYPCAYDLPNVLCVTASDFIGERPSWANIGARSVDVAAPGVSIISTIPGGGWGPLTGTSMAAPHVSGAAALMLAHEPQARPQDLKDAILATAVPLPAFDALTVSGGRLDVAAAMRSVRATPKPPKPPATETPAPVPTDPVPTSPAPEKRATVRVSAQLKVRRARVLSGRLDVLAAITRRAAGSVSVTFRSHGKTTRLRARIAQGRIRVSHRLPRAQRTGSGIMTLTWAGSSTVRAAGVRLRTPKRAH